MLIYYQCNSFKNDLYSVSVLSEVAEFLSESIEKYIETEKMELSTELIHHLWRVTRLKFNLPLHVDFYFDNLSKMFDMYELVHDQIVKAREEAAVQKAGDIEI